MTTKTWIVALLVVRLLTMPIPMQSLDVMEFGRRRTAADEPRQALLEEDWAFFLHDASFSMSLEHSPAPSTVDVSPPSTTAPSASPPTTVSFLPSFAPTTTAENTLTRRPTTTPTTPVPTLLPTASSPPTFTRLPTAVPTLSAHPSAPPSSNPTPTLFLEKVVFTCSDQGGVALAQRPFTAATTIPFTVAYLIETFGFLEDFRADLEAQVLADAVMGALNCGPGVFATAEPPVVPMQTILTGEVCTPEISLCTVLETNFNIVVTEDRSPEASAFLGYVRLSNEMAAYPVVIPPLDRVQYLRPLLFPPLLDGTANATQPPIFLGGVESTGSLSPWTMGSVLAVCLGGVAALGVWARNRQRRNEQHMQLLEDMSVASPMEAA